MSLSEVLGQPLAVTILQKSLEKGRLAHAYLFYGDDGVGKETTVRILARDSLLRVVEGSPTIKIDQIRMLREQSSYTQSSSLIWLIRDADQMTVEAANAFLKVLEEPTPGVYFFLTTTNIHRVLPTIVSRCQVIPFRSIPESIIQSTWRRDMAKLLTTQVRLAPAWQGFLWPGCRVLMDLSRAAARGHR